MTRWMPAAALLAMFALSVGCRGTGMYDPMMYGSYGGPGYGAAGCGTHGGAACGRCGECDCDDDDGDDCCLDEAVCCVVGGTAGVAGRAVGLVAYGTYGLGKYLLCGDSCGGLSGCGHHRNQCVDPGYGACVPTSCDPCVPMMGDPCCPTGVADPFAAPMYGAPGIPMTPGCPTCEPGIPTYAPSHVVPGPGVTPADPGMVPPPETTVPPEGAVYYGEPVFSSVSAMPYETSPVVPSYSTPGYIEGPVEISAPIEVGQPVLTVPGQMQTPPPAPPVQEGAAAMPTIRPGSHYVPASGAAPQGPVIRQVAAETQWTRGFPPAAPAQQR